LPACWKKTFNPLLLDPNNQLQLNNISFSNTRKRYRKKRELLVEDSELPAGWKLLAQDLKTQNSKFNANDFDFTLFEKKVILYTTYFFYLLTYNKLRVSHFFYFKKILFTKLMTKKNVPTFWTWSSHKDKKKYSASTINPTISCVYIPCRQLLYEITVQIV